MRIFILSLLFAVIFRQITGGLGDKGFRIDGFFDITSSACGQDPFAIPHHGIGGHCDDRHTRKFAMFFQFRADRIAVHLRELDIEQYGPRLVAQRHCDAIPAVSGLDNHKPALFPQEAHQIQILGVVFNDQQGIFHGNASVLLGNRMVKMLPWPHWLSTWMLPPIISRSFWQMESPSPVPSYFRVNPVSIWWTG